VFAIQSEAVGVDWDDRVLATHSSPHFMQSAAWAEAKHGGPWKVSRRCLGLDREYPVQVFERAVDRFGVLAHLPRVSGLRVDDVAALTERIRHEHPHAFAAKVEIYQPRDDALAGAFREHGWSPARASQYRHGVVVQTGLAEGEIFARMKKRARNEIRAAERNGVAVLHVELNDEHRRTMRELVRTTADRSQAYFRRPEYVEAVWNAFAARAHGRLYFAYHEERVVAGAFILTYGTTAWYKDGGSLREKPQLMASRLLHWGIIRDLASSGIERYDLGNIPPPGEDGAPGQGLLTFKTAFTDDVVEYMPAFQLSFTDEADQWRRRENEFLRAYHERTGDYWY
jgi:serine/alanine adding enzyme